MNLGLTEIYLDDKLCGSFDETVASGVWHTFDCGGSGMTGARIRLQRTTVQTLAFCGIRVFGVEPDDYVEYTLRDHRKTLANLEEE